MATSRSTVLFLVTISVIVGSGPAIFGTVQAAQQVSISQSAMTSTTVAPGDNVTLTASIQVSSEVDGPAIDITLPSTEWNITPIDSDNGTYKPSEHQWVWLSGNHTIIYDVTVPANSTSGNYSIVAEGSAYDLENDTQILDSTTTTITVGDSNEPPTANFSYSPTNPTVNNTVELNGSLSSDPDGDSLSYNWTIESGSSTTTSTLVATDFESGSLSSDGWSFNPFETEADGGVNTCVAHSGSHSAYLADGEGAIESSTLNTSDSTSVSIQYAVRPGGDSECSDIIEDNDGEDLVIEFLDDSGSWVPVKTIDATSDTTWQTGSLQLNETAALHSGFQLRFHALGFDHQGEAWHIDDVNVTSHSDSTTTSLTGETVDHIFNASGDYNVTLTVSDPGGESDSTSKVLTVNETQTSSNSPPTADFTYSPTHPSTGETVTFNGSSSSDPDSDSLSYEWAIEDNGSLSGTLIASDFESGSLSTDGWSFNALESGADGGVNTCVANSGSHSAYLADGEGAIESSALDTSDSTTVSIQYAVRPGGDSECSDIIEDNDGEDLVIEFLDDDGNWVGIKTIDATSDTSWISGSIDIMEERAFHNKFKLRFHALGFDHQGEAWHIDDVNVTSHSDSTTTSLTGETVDHIFNASGDYNVTLTVSDPGGESDSTSEVVTVNETETSSNTAPTAEFSYSPTEPSTGETVTFNGSLSSDPDGDSLSYEWTIQANGSSSAELLSTDFESGSLSTDGWSFNPFETEADGGVNTCVENSGSHSAYLADGEGAIESSTLNTSDSTSVSIQYAVRPGGDSECSDIIEDNDGEDLVIEYLDDSSNWVPVKTIDATSDTTWQTGSLELGESAAFHSGFQLRFHALGFDHQDEAWHIDDVNVTSHSDSTTTSLTGETVDHTFNASGDYNVTLTVSDPGGESDSTSKVVTVN